MKSFISKVCLLIVLATCALADVDLTKPIAELRLKDGTILHDVSIKSFGSTTVMVRHANGAGTIRLDLFPDEMLSALNPARKGEIAKNETPQDQRVTSFMRNLAEPLPEGISLNDWYGTREYSSLMGIAAGPADVAAQTANRFLEFLNSSKTVGSLYDARLISLERDSNTKLLQFTITLTAKQPPAASKPPPSDSKPAAIAEAVQNTATVSRQHTVNPGGSFGTVILGLTGIAGLTFWALYRRSETGRMHRRMREIIDSFEHILQGQKDLTAKLQTEIKATASEYLNEVKRGYLMSISIDEVRRVTPGLRLKPLHDRGLNTLLAVQGWDASRFSQLRGIGPESARQIALACAALTKAALGQPVAHPRLTDSSNVAQKLFRQIYAFGQVQEILSGQEAALGAILKQGRPQCAMVGNQTTFLRWMLGSEDKGALQTALVAGAAIEAKQAPKEEMGHALVEGRTRLTSAVAISQQPVAAQSVAADVAANGELYRICFIKLLGNMARQPREPVQRLVQEQAEPARDPVRVRTPSGTNPGFSINISIGEAEPPEIPAGSAARAAECWVPAGRSATVGDLKVAGGMIYVGRKLPSVNGRTVEPALIDPAQPFSGGEADCHVRMLNYWSSYSYASPAARASYLQWLTTGRSDPAADIGYVFLFFYGLERRVLADAKIDETARTEIPAIIEEVRRLRSIYGQNGSFNRYSAEFMDFVEASQSMQAGGADNEQPPPLTRYQLTFGLRRKLGQLAAAGKPLPPNWAYTWYHNDPRTRLPAAAERCPEHTARLFAFEYNRQLGEGLVLPANKTRLKLTYRPASASFGSSLAQSADLPDVSILTASYAKLDAIAVECFRQLDAYSRFVGRNRERKDTFDGLVLLPVSLWPAAWQQQVADLAKLTVGEVVPTLKYKDLLVRFGHEVAPARLTYVGWCRSLAAAGIGLEPDPRFGGEVPDLEDTVAVFATDGIEHVSEGFGLAALLLRLAAAVAAADGAFTDQEMKILQDEIQGNATVKQEDKRRLLARLARFRAQAPGLTGLKPTIQQMNAEARAKVTDFLLTMIYTDRTVAPAEVKVMEKVYTLFGMEPAALYTRLHELSAGAKPTPVSAGQKAGPIQLNAAKVQQLRAVSDEVTKKLAVIFDAEHAAVLAAEKKETEEPEPAPVGTATLLDLDVAHAELLALLVGRTQWTRAEFEELCADKDLLPDGALERINDAAFTKFDQAIIEGEDPLEIAGQLLEETTHASNH
ncbi:MAG: TerB N-terminal domain-containing protein [Lacunisphaera sp.]|nr:TerB N-terminal domain-containing protein [Lacunisphaera sp.]